MQSLKPVLLLLLLAVCTLAESQTLTPEEADIKSYALYEKGDWKELLKYGKTAVASGQDFLYLRLRMGYAAFMLSNFSEALKQYDKVLKSDKTNTPARYYIWLCNKYLNRLSIGDASAKHLSPEVIASEKLKPVSLTSAGIESSYKFTDVNIRGNSSYNKISLSHRLGYNIHMTHAGALYNQTISEVRFAPYVINANNIAINQKEYYNRTSININRKWQLIGAYHYLKTPFNNFSYNNQIGLAGIKYFANYFDVQADAVFAKLTDSSRNQYNLNIGVYPLGNLNLYAFSTFSYRTNAESGFNFKQVAGFKVLKNLWLEGNATFGEFKNYVENDALYVYNAIDKNLFKGGATVYLTLSPHILAQAGYTFEQRQLYATTINFNQQSITGGLSWKF